MEEEESKMAAFCFEQPGGWSTYYLMNPGVVIGEKQVSCDCLVTQILTCWSHMASEDGQHLGSKHIFGCIFRDFNFFLIHALLHLLVDSLIYVSTLDWGGWHYGFVNC